MPKGNIKTTIERSTRPASPAATPSTSEGGPRVPSLQIGQIVTAQVIEPLAGGRYLIAVTGTPLEAIAPQGLAVGTELALRVEHLTPTITFRMLSCGPNSETDILQILRTRLPNYGTAGDAVQTLRQEWRNLGEQLPVAEAFPHTAKLYDFLNHLLPEEGLPSAEQLAAYVRDGGQFYEAKLVQQAAQHSAALATVAEGDVKGLLLGALRELEVAANQSTTADLTLAVRKYLDHIECQQALHLLAQRHDDPFPLHIPAWLGQAFATILLADERNSPGKIHARGEEEGGYRVLFRLDLDGLGQTHIEARANAHALRVVFYLEQWEALQVLRRELPALEIALQGLGFPEVLIDARPLAGLSSDERQALETRTAAVPDGIHLVDVKV
jgi:hypothetical protein